MKTHSEPRYKDAALEALRYVCKKECSDTL